MGRTLKLAWSADSRTFVTVCLLNLLPASIPPVMIMLGKEIVDLVSEAAIREVTSADYLPVVIALGVLAALQRGMGALQGTRQELFGVRMQMAAEARFLEKAAVVDLGHFDNSDWHDRMARAQKDIGWRPNQMTWALVGIGGNAVTFLGMMAVLLSLHPFLMVLSLLSVVPSVVIQQRVNRKIYEFWWVETPDDREKGYLAELLSKPRTSKEVRSFILAKHLRTRHRVLADDQYRRMRSLYMLYDKSAWVSASIAGSMLGLAYLFVAREGVAGNLSPGALTAVIAAFASVAQQVNLLTSSLLSLDQHATFLQDYYDFLAIEDLVPVSAEPSALPRRLDGGIEFDDVWFTYPGGSEPALAGLTLTVRPGELLALVGDNGAGKTSLVKLLLRFYDPDRGSVRIGGVDLRDVDPIDLRSRIGILFQDYATYELSARENVQLGRVDRPGGDEAIEAALQAARADSVIKSLRHGLDSKVGRLFEGGHDLSGGEWQRLALARLLYRDADIWILDEPTAALDPEAEAAIFAELRAQLHGRMGIVISHRFSTVRIADRIAVVNDGRVTEEGTHEELIALGGRYAELFEIQAAGYR